MKLEVLAGILEREGLAVLGESLFLHWMPEVKIGALMRLPLDGIAINHYLPGFYHHPLQVIVRDADMEALIPRCEAISAALTIETETAFDGMLIKHLWPKALPIYYPRSVGGAVEGSINFDCCYVLG